MITSSWLPHLLCNDADAGLVCFVSEDEDDDDDDDDDDDA